MPASVMLLLLTGRAYPGGRGSCWGGFEVGVCLCMIIGSVLDDVRREEGKAVLYIFDQLSVYGF